MKKAIIKEVEMKVYCPYCDAPNIIRSWSPTELHQESHMKECEKCYSDFYWCAMVQDELSGMPKYKIPISSR